MDCQGPPKCKCVEVIVYFTAKGETTIFISHIQTDAEYDVELASEATAWIKEVVGEGDFKSNNSADVQEALKDGVLLCKLINVLQPGSVEKINTSSKAKFKQVRIS